MLTLLIYFPCIKYRLVLWIKLNHNSLVIINWSILLYFYTFAGDGPGNTGLISLCHPRTLREKATPLPSPK